MEMGIRLYRAPWPGECHESGRYSLLLLNQTEEVAYDEGREEMGSPNAYQ